MERVDAALTTDDFYAEFTGRNLGFVTEEEQERLRNARVFVCGVGGMGGACVLSLVRAGVGTVAIADIDHFEASNLNRQVFAFTDTLGKAKVEAVREKLHTINPRLEVEACGSEWVDELDRILPRYPVVVNGMDDISAGVRLYRKAREHGATVVDAYASPLPSVTVVRPHDPRPEERLGFPTVGRSGSEITEEHVEACLLKEIEYVLTHSSSARHIDLDVAREFLAGRRERSSFAPMVITAGNLMCFEAIGAILGRSSATDFRGYFFNPWTVRVERPRSRLLAWGAGLLVRRFLGSVTRR